MLNSGDNAPTRFGSLSAFAPAISVAMHKEAGLYDVALREDGLLPGTLIGTASGWRGVETIQPGDLVLTFDNGMQRIEANHKVTIAQASLPAHKAFMMVIPAGVLGNRKQITLLPCQEVIVESDLAEIDFGEPFVLIQALMLEGYGGIHRAPITGDVTVHMLTFASEQVIHCAGAALVSARAESDFSPLHAAAAVGASSDTPRLNLSQLHRIAENLKQDAACTGFAAHAASFTYAAADSRFA
ncbi:Hint domain-containing protein [Roseinatronobacter alkalisoli]|uniref:Hint domain-containing protein n=1 Tax=Roseinatronobacter alkalisoli TaxID=3028235 RepID=A0ABT5T3R3_9RHOB|nr:Hint domain-containing protein [Roseinatronobacter sp. HJB301]MDD7969764.1 Hint domain-containing protein [Roseinatronobacter sp. HJB301]